MFCKESIILANVVSDENDRSELSYLFVFQRLVFRTYIAVRSLLVFPLHMELGESILLSLFLYIICVNHSMLPLH